MRHLQRQHITRIYTQQLAKPCLGELVIVGKRGGERGKVQSLALVGRQAHGAREHRARRSDASRIAAAQEQPRLQHMRHQEAGRLLQCHRKLRVGAAPPALERAKRAFVCLQGGRRGSRDAASALVNTAHGEGSFPKMVATLELEIRRH